MLRYSKLVEQAKAPLRKNPDDAGVDVFALNSVSIQPLNSVIVQTGISFSIPQGFMLLAKPKSRSDFMLGAGVLDAGYEGEVLIKVVNYRDRELQIKAGDPIAQLILVPVVTPPVEEVPLAELHQGSTRGASGGILTQHQNTPIK
jgi:dUTP pyrophosphatase